MLPSIKYPLRTAVITLLALMVIVVSWQVISRYVLSSPSPWTEEVARMVLVWLGFLGAAYAHSEDAHLGIDLLEESLAEANRARLNILIDLICLVFAAAVLVLGGSLLVQLTWQLEQTTAVLGIPMAWVYSVLPLSGFLICLHSLTNIFKGRKPA